MDNISRNGNLEQPVVNEASPLLSRPLPDLSLENTHETSNNASKSPSRTRPNSALLLEAQRRSADFHLGEYLSLRSSIWSDLITRVTTAENAPFAGDVDALVQDVWRFTVTKDQLQSDLIMMIELLGKFLDTATRRFGWSVFYFLSIGCLTVWENSFSDKERLRYLRHVLWGLLGASGVHFIYSGLGCGLSLWLSRRATATLDKLERYELLERNRADLRGWIWNLPRFSNVL